MLAVSLMMSVCLWIYISFKFEETEKRNSERSMTRVLGVLEREVSVLDSFCRDYAFWDDTYNFVTGYNEKYVRDNFSVSYLKTQKIHFICLVSTKGKIIYKAVYNPQTYEPAIPGELKDHSPMLHSLFSDSMLKSVKGIINTSEGNMMVSSHPVSDSRMKAPPRGRLIMGRYLSTEEVAGISSMLRTDVRLTDPEHNREISDALVKGINPDRKSFITETGTDSIRVYSMLTDILGNPAAVVLLNHSRDIKSIGIQTVKFTLVLIAFFTILLFSALVFFLKSSVIRPVRLLTDTAWDITREHDFSKRLSEVNVDEFSMLARSFNSIVDMLCMANVNLEARISERTAALIEANRELTLMHQIFIHSLEGIVITNADVEIQNVNPAFTDITGYSPEEVIGKNPRILKSDLHDRFYFEKMWKSLMITGQWSGEIWNRHRDEKAYPEWLSISVIKDEDGKITNYVGVFHDISDAKRQEELIRHQAYHDSLTGLPNRMLLTSRIDRAIAHSARNNSRFGLIFLDLDNFKNVNDSLGHAMGDLLLKEAAEKLRRIARNDDTVARLGGDEFIILVEDITDEKPAVILARRIILAFKESFNIKNNSLHVGASIGIAMYPEDGQEPESLIKNADIAMYRAKDVGRQTFALFKPSLNESVARKLKLENELRLAISESNFEVYYQPKMDIRNGTVTGMEGLVRWKHTNGIINPGDFIPLAEEIGIINEIDRIVKQKAFTEVGELNHSRQVPHRLALNCSAKSLNFKGLPDIISSALSKYNFKPEWFELEITETSIMRDIAASRAILYMLLETGICVTLDDFGTGYSSLSQLKNLPIHALKIDRSFIWELDQNRSDAHITESIIALSHSIGVEVVAEGVENSAQLDFLRNAGCDLAQGYFISRPLPITDFIAFTGISR